jgi:hypothetical protein
MCGCGIGWGRGAVDGGYGSVGELLEAEYAAGFGQGIFVSSWGLELANGWQDNFIEFENLLGEPLREGKKAGVKMPTLEVLYQLAKAIQWRNMEKRGLVDVPGKK